jgi:hypothetical protein
MLLALALLAQDWWSADWEYRRPLAVANRGDEALPAGVHVALRVDAAHLGMKEKCAEDFADVVLVHRGARVPFLVRPGTAGRFVVHFRTQAEVPARGTDGAYALYYGCGSAPKNGTAPLEVFDYHEDFSGAAPAVEVDRAVSATVEKGALVVTDVAADRTALSPARILLKKAAPAGGFSLSLDLDIEVKEGAQVAVGVLVDIRDEVAEDPAAQKRVASLLEALSDSDFETREAATRDLIKMGKGALKQAQEAAKTASDAEAKWRAEHVVERIRADHPPKSIWAMLQTAEGVKVATRSTTVGKASSTYPNAVPLPGRVAVTVQRDPAGDVTVLWNGIKPDTGEMAGEVKEIAIVLFKGVSGSFGRVAIDNIVITRFAGEDATPTLTLQVEERRKK